jgi:RNA polymerase sigma factor (TIGR02999 family)
MGSPETHSITRHLASCRDGDRQALEQVVSHLYDDLRRIARRQLRRGRPGETLNTTGLVHETYLKLVGSSRIDCQSRGQFLALVARAMRNIIIDYARQQQTRKRGGDRARVQLDEAELVADESSEALLVLDQALDRLASYDQSLALLVECRFFAGMTEEETATALGVSRSKVQRDWVRARAWLRDEVGAMHQDQHETTRG